MTKNSVSLDIEPSILENNMRIVQETPIEKELKNMFENVDTVPCRTVTPNPGFCVKSFTKPDRKKIFVNVCTTDAIPSPRDISTEELRNILNSDDPSNYRLPMSLGEGRIEKDKSGLPITVYDVAINPDFFEKIQREPLFQSFFLTVAFEGLQDKYQFEADMQSCIILKNRKSFGTLQSHRIQMRDIQPCQEELKTPLIQEIKNVAALEKVEIVYRLHRVPISGDIEHLVVEYKIPPNVNVTEISLDANDDRIILECKSLNQTVDIMLPYNIQYNDISAQLNRNNDVMSVKMPVVKS